MGSPRAISEVGWSQPCVGVGQWWLCWPLSEAGHPLALRPLAKRWMSGAQPPSSPGIGQGAPSHRGLLGVQEASVDGVARCFQASATRNGPKTAPGKQSAPAARLPPVTSRVTISSTNPPKSTQSTHTNAHSHFVFIPALLPPPPPALGRPTSWSWFNISTLCISSHRSSPSHDPSPGLWLSSS